MDKIVMKNLELGYLREIVVLNFDGGHVKSVSNVVKKNFNSRVNMLVPDNIPIVNHIRSVLVSFDQ